MADDKEIQKQFDRAVKTIIEKLLRQADDAVKEARNLLDQTRSDVIARLAEQGLTEWDQFRLRQVKAAIEARIAQLQAQLEASLNGQFNKAIDLANELIDEPLRASIGVTNIFGVSRELAQTASLFSATMIRDLTSSAQAAIDNVLRRAALGGLTVAEAIAQIGKSLDDSKTFSSIAARAETIFRTEVMRIQSIAASARMKLHREGARRAGWEIGKQWIATPDKRVRLTHLAAMGQVRAQDEPFDVGGEKLQYPRDPKGSAANTINCRCVAAPTLERVYKLDRTTKFER